MNILIIPSAYPTEDAPLRSTFFKEQAIGLVEDGHKVGVIYSETRRITGISGGALKKYHFQIRNSNESGINTLRLHGWNVFMMRNNLGIGLWVKQSLRLFKIYIEKYGKPDIIHVHLGLYGGIVAKKIKEKYGIPYVITEHSSIIMNHLLNDNDKKILKDVYDNADMLISVGNKLKVAMAEYTSNKIVVIPNIVDTTAFKFDSNKNEKEENFTFISVCLLKANKNVDITLKAFKEVSKNTKCNLVIVGDGPEKNNLLQLAKSLKVEDKVKFLGAVPREELPKQLDSADAFVLPSKFETFGVAYIEALACGLPIITTACGGPEDFYNSNLGYMIDTADVNKLAKAMKDMIKNYNLFDREEMSKDIKNKFSKKIIVNKLNEIYNEIVN